MANAPLTVYRDEYVKVTLSGGSGEASVNHGRVRDMNYEQVYYYIGSRCSCLGRPNHSSASAVYAGPAHPDVDAGIFLGHLHPCENERVSCHCSSCGDRHFRVREVAARQWCSSEPGITGRRDGQPEANEVVRG